MALPLSIWDFSLWSAIVAVILLVTSEFLSPQYGRTRIMVDRHRLRIAALVATVVFLSTVVYKIYEMLVKP